MADDIQKTDSATQRALDEDTKMYALQAEESPARTDVQGLGNEELKKKEEEKKEKKNSKHLLFLQLKDIADSIEALDEKIKDYGTTIRQAKDIEIRLGDATRLAPNIKDVLQEYAGREGRNRLLVESYGELSALGGTEDNLWASLKNNIIHDTQGHMVYMDEVGKLYRLARDSEGNVLTQTNPETGEKEPVREMIANEAELLELYSKAYTTNPPGLFANETPFGEDTTNSIYHTQNQWGIIYKGTNAPIPQHPIASHEKTEEGFIGCGYIGGLEETCTQAKYELGLEIKAQEDKLNGFKDRRNALDDRLNKSENLTEEERKNLKEEINNLDGEIALADQELKKLVGDLKNPSNSLNNVFPVNSSYSFATVGGGQNFTTNGSDTYFGDSDEQEDIDTPAYNRDLQREEELKIAMEKVEALKSYSGSGTYSVAKEDLDKIIDDLDLSESEVSHFRNKLTEQMTRKNIIEVKPQPGAPSTSFASSLNDGGDIKVSQNLKKNFVEAHDNVSKPAVQEPGYYFPSPLLKNGMDQ